jgi:hypothetical protein
VERVRRHGGGREVERVGRHGGGGPRGGAQAIGGERDGVRGKKGGARWNSGRRVGSRPRGEAEKVTVHGGGSLAEWRRRGDVDAAAIARPRGRGYATGRTVADPRGRRGICRAASSASLSPADRRRGRLPMWGLRA